MNKRIRLVTLCLAMLAVLFFSTATAFADSAVLMIGADKTEARPGDTISFSVTLGPVSDMGTMQMIIVIPEGLTYVEGSGKLADGLKNTLGFDYADFTEASMMVNGVASKADYSSDGNTLLCTFECTVDEGFTGTAEVGLKKLEFYSCRTWQDHTDEYSVSKAVIKAVEDEVPADPDPSGSDDPGEQPQPGGNTDPKPSGSEDPGEQPQPGGNTDPEPSGSEDPGEQPQPGGNTDPEPSGSEDPGEQPQPGGNTDPEPSDSEDPGEQTQPGGNTDPEPSGSEEKTPSEPQPGDKTPDNEKTDDKKSDEKESGDKTPSGEDRPSEENAQPSGEDGQKQPDPSSQGKDGVDPGDKEKGSEDPDKNPQSTLIWLAAAIAVAVVTAILLIVMKRKKNKEK